MRAAATDADVNPNFNRITYDLGRSLNKTIQNNTYKDKIKFTDLGTDWNSTNLNDLDASTDNVKNWFEIKAETGYFTLLQSLATYPFEDFGDDTIQVFILKIQYRGKIFFFSFKKIQDFNFYFQL